MSPSTVLSISPASIIFPTISCDANFSNSFCVILENVFGIQLRVPVRVFGIADVVVGFASSPAFIYGTDEEDVRAVVVESVKFDSAFGFPSLDCIVVLRQIVESFDERTEDFRYHTMFAVPASKRTADQAPAVIVAVLDVVVEVAPVVLELFAYPLPESRAAFAVRLDVVYFAPFLVVVIGITAVAVGVDKTMLVILFHNSCSFWYANIAIIIETTKQIDKKKTAASHDEAVLIIKLFY